MNLDTPERNKLLAIAKQSIEAGLDQLRWVAMPQMTLAAALNEHRGSFVTLRIHKQLRGCCGNLTADHAVSEDVWRNAWASAFADPRFAPLEREEWPEADVQISILSSLETVSVQSEEQLLEILRPNIDGLVLERDEARATFLPEVWEQLPNPAEFVRHLKEKAGWPGTSWSRQIKVQRYTTENFGETGGSEHPRRKLHVAL